MLSNFFLNGTSFMRLVFTLLSSLILSLPAFAELEGKRPKPEGWFYGIGVGFSESIYKGDGNRVIPIPGIGYIGERFNLLGPFVSYELYENGPFDANAKLAVRFDGYDADDSDFLKGMKDRDRSLDGGFSLGLQREDIARLELEYMHDTLSHHKGSETSIQLSRQFNKGPFFFVPEVSAHYLNQKLVDYYYGVEQNEATLERGRYEGRSGWNYRADLNFSTPILFGGFTRLDLGYIWYSNSITDSPIVDQTEGYNIRFAYTRFF
ncbi:hypothetical protein A3739_02645 [Oleiphilus sp. HI0067]|nr:hypothetical protein A3739_02645 [Oleiphilus sp. HI0067]